MLARREQDEEGRKGKGKGEGEEGKGASVRVQGEGESEGEWEDVRRESTFEGPECVERYRRYRVKEVRKGNVGSGTGSDSTARSKWREGT